MTSPVPSQNGQLETTSPSHTSHDRPQPRFFLHSNIENQNDPCEIVKIRPRKRSEKVFEGHMAYKHVHSSLTWEIQNSIYVHVCGLLPSIYSRCLCETLCNLRSWKPSSFEKADCYHRMWTQWLSVDPMVECGPNG